MERVNFCDACHQPTEEIFEWVDFRKQYCEKCHTKLERAKVERLIKTRCGDVAAWDWDGYCLAIDDGTETKTYNRFILVQIGSLERVKLPEGYIEKLAQRLGV